MKDFDFDLLVIGGGAAGFVSSKLARGFGKKVAMVECAKIGGDCTWFGCIPSKTLLKAGHIAHQLKHLEDYGLKTKHPVALGSDNVMSHVRSIVQKVYNSHLPESFEKMGIRVLSGEPQFIDNHTIRLGDKVLSAKKFIISTGSRALIPDIEGIKDIPYLTNKTVFDLNTLPNSMIVLGGGPIGIELASAFNRLGVDVTVVEMTENILPREDKEMADMLRQRLEAEGLKILTSTKAAQFLRDGDKVVLNVQDEKCVFPECIFKRQIIADTSLIAVGRTANVEGLQLEKAGVEYTSKGIKTNEMLQTTAKNIYACGDVAGPYQFSHMSEYQAVIATTNAFLPFKRKVDYTDVVWCTFTDPELAHAGLTEKEARDRYGDKIKIYRYEYNRADRAKTDNAETGMSKFICDKKGRLLGVHILGSCAGEIMHEAQLAKSFKIPFYKIQRVIHAYPSYSDVLRQPAKLCYIDTLQNNPFIKLLKKFF
jgi:pyruvate/2-oxoglutarate dehydrogenase complex dihydrolipoamide dehydrogenase (E3) component